MPERFPGAVPPTLVCAPRSPAKLAAVIDSLELTVNPLFLPQVFPGMGKRTKCNKAVEAFCDLMGVHLPKGLLALQQIAWLNSPAARLEKWFPLISKTADEAADKGQPVLVGWVNPVPNESSHIAMMRRAGRIGQAGKSNFSDGTIAQGFGNRAVSFWGHL